MYALCGVMVRASEDVRCYKKVREVFSMMMAARFGSVSSPALSLSENACARQGAEPEQSGGKHDNLDQERENFARQVH